MTLGDVIDTLRNLSVQPPAQGINRTAPVKASPPLMSPAAVGVPVISPVAVFRLRPAGNGWGSAGSERIGAAPMHAGGAAEWADIFAGLAITGHFLSRDVLTDRHADPLAARARLVAMLKRAVA